MTGLSNWIFGRRSETIQAAAREPRTAKFRMRSGNRYWWFHGQKEAFDPPIFSFLTEDEWNVLDRWYDETDRMKSAGEANIPAMSMLQAIVMGNNVSNLVQLGHFQGFSTLLLGFMFRRAGRRRALFTIDIDAGVSRFTQHWVNEAELGDYVHIAVGSSSDSRFPAAAEEYFGDRTQMIFIDSSHAYDQTVAELDLWYPKLASCGLIVLHDASHFAARFDPSGKGGVAKALEDWSKNQSLSHFAFNAKIPEDILATGKVIYKDACGLGIIQGAPGGSV